MMLIFGPLSGVLERRFGPKLPLTLGAIAVVAAFALPAVSHDAVWQLLASGILTGAGIGLVFAAMSNAIIESVPATQTGEATSVNSIVRTIGGSIGSAVVAAVIAADTTSQGIPADRAFTVGFWVSAAVAAVAVVASLALPSARRRHQQAVAAGVGPPGRAGGDSRSASTPRGRASRLRVHEHALAAVTDDGSRGRRHRGRRSALGARRSALGARQACRRAS